MLLNGIPIFLRQNTELLIQSLTQKNYWAPPFVFVFFLGMERFASWPFSRFSTAKTAFSRTPGSIFLHYWIHDNEMPVKTHQQLTATSRERTKSNQFDIGILQKPILSTLQYESPGILNKENVPARKTRCYGLFFYDKNNIQISYFRYSGILSVLCQCPTQELIVPKRSIFNLLERR
jgi:hypothetical protein